ncbi:hypothetical protein SAY86_025047 [Trapa natans]|uniref:Uncharacterized protein n=1 Tax=Trapa natans TaxID=22666 RepID=A0AAN7RDV3_TRANT|nr:hypothetical protein SAY86_025047 [Trapa natans]
MCPRKTGAAANSAPQSAPPQIYIPPPVVIAPPTPAQKAPGKWTTGLFDCYEDVPNCVITLMCPCITFGQIAEIVDKGTTTCCGAATICSCLSCLFFGFFCCYTCTFRSKVRGLSSIPGDPLIDCFIHLLLYYCAFCQEYRELKNRGLDPSAGWAASHQTMQQPAIPVVMAPPVQMMHH